MSRAYRWLAVVPAIGMLGGIPFANRVEPYVFGLPFLLAWIVGWVLITSATMALIYRLDASRAALQGSAAAGNNITAQETLR